MPEAEAAANIAYRTDATDRVLSTFRACINGYLRPVPDFGAWKQIHSCDYGPLYQVGRGLPVTESGSCHCRSVFWSHSSTLSATLM